MQEESRLQSLKREVEGSVYATKGYRHPGQNQGQNQIKDRVGKSDLVCSYCKKSGHIKDKCWQLHGRPPHLARAHAVQNSQQNSQTGSGSIMPSAANVTGNSIMTPAQDFQTMLQEIQHLKNLLNHSNSVISSTSLANSGKNYILSSLTLFTTNLTTAWLLDSGATDHMTPLSNIFTSYESVAPRKNVQTADGTLLPVAGIGAINLKPIGHITYVLHVPKLFVSLVSVQKLASLKNYNILFDDLDACQLGKFKRSTYLAKNNRTKRAFQILHCDVWGPSPHIDLLGHQYFLICTDDHSRFTWLFLLKHKSEVTYCIKNLCKLIMTQFW